MKSEQSRERGSALFLAVLNDSLASTTSRWRTGITRRNIREDAVIIKAICDIAKELGYGLEIKLASTAVLAAEIPGLTSEAKKYVSQESNGNISIFIPSNEGSKKTHSRNLSLTANSEYLFLMSKGATKGYFRRSDVLSIKAVEKK